MNTTNTTNKRISLAPLRWHEDLDAALDEAQRRNVPIVSLRLLGRLDEELSCANSRFFRAMLYPDARVSRALSQAFVLHWRSVRPVPVVTIDYGDGRILKRTLTGNSAHLVLDQRGRPVDALPGMFTPRGFLDALAWSRSLARSTAVLDGHARVRALARAHAAPPAYTQRPGDAPMPSPSGAPTRGNAREAGQLAMTKMMVERPLLDQIDDIATTVRRDESFNQTVLHPLVHARFARGAERVGDDDEATFTEWLYDEVFQMPSTDPWLGLVQGYAALDDDGRAAA
jgi:hypothetical protein